MTGRLKILAVEPSPAELRQLETVARRLGHEVSVALDGTEAVAKFRAESPDLVFMETVLPDMDCGEAVRQLRAQPSDRWVPIVFHSAMERIAGILHCLECGGGDDYLTKPASPQAIQAKLNSYARVLAMQADSRRNAHELLAWREDAEEQSRLGQHVISRLLDSKGLRDPMIRWLNTPAQTFSGDLVCAARGPDDALYVMLADAAGHGLAAALTALPMTQVFHGMAQKGFPIHRIAEELNSKLRAFLPADRFVAASLATVDVRTQTIEIWNGGTPEVLFIAEDGQVSMRWPSRHPPLGILPPELFSNATETVNYQHPGEMVVVSDGIIELEDPAGQRLNQHGLEAILGKAAPGRRLAAIEAGVAHHLDGRSSHDDVSAIVIKVPIESRNALRNTQAQAPLQAHVSEWRMELGWGPSELRDLDVVPAVLGFMGQIKALRTHQHQLFMIVSELFNNALDHGILGLDSRTKNLDGGFERYLEEREARLAGLADGHVGMAFHLHMEDDRPVLDIRVQDSGAGFDHVAYLSAPDDERNLYQTHGRGIRLVQTLCLQLAYADNGSAVFARYGL